MIATKKKPGRNALPLPVHAGNLIAWEGTTGTVEASDLGHGVASRVWDDAADVGFWVRSHRTGNEVLFTWEGDNVRDGELVATRYRSEDGRFTVTVFND